MFCHHSYSFCLKETSTYSFISILQDFYDLMSREGQSVMRRLDVVTVKGSEVPIGIYTYDALQDQFFKEDRWVHTSWYFVFFLLCCFCIFWNLFYEFYQCEEASRVVCQSPFLIYHCTIVVLLVTTSARLASSDQILSKKASWSPTLPSPVKWMLPSVPPIMVCPLFIYLFIFVCVIKLEDRRSMWTWILYCAFLCLCFETFPHFFIV